MPNKSKITRITTIRPTPPLGPYPHDRLCGQAGITPKSAKTKTMSNIVPSDMISSPFKKNLIQTVCSSSVSHPAECPHQGCKPPSHPKREDGSVGFSAVSFDGHIVEHHLYAMDIAHKFGSQFLLSRIFSFARQTDYAFLRLNDCFESAG